MEAPESLSAVKRFCAVVQYMAKFLPDLSSSLELNRALTRKSVAWNWSSDCDEAFNTIKQKFVTTPVLTFFDASKHVTVQVDSSQFGLGAVLLHDKLVEYAFLRLSPAECNWTQIEKEALVILFGPEHFDQYTYSRAVTVENDLKPIASILKKTLSSGPRWLHDTRVRLGRYDFDSHFIKGTNLVLVDALSRARLGSEHEVHPRIMTVSTYTAITDARVDEMKAVTEVDCDLQELVCIIQDGWSDKRSDVPQRIQQCFDFHDTLNYYDGLSLVVKGEAVVIPMSQRSDMKSWLHQSHLAYDGMLRKTRGVIFWPNMQKDKTCCRFFVKYLMPLSRITHVKLCFSMWKESHDKR